MRHVSLHPITIKDAVYHLEAPAEMPVEEQGKYPSAVYHSTHGRALFLHATFGLKGSKGIQSNCYLQLHYFKTSLKSIAYFLLTV